MNCRINYDCLIGHRCDAGDCRDERINLDMKKVTFPIDIVTDNHAQLLEHLNVNLCEKYHCEPVQRQPFVVNVEGGSRLVFSISSILIC